jgi:uncharacterized membrane protein YkoI
MGRILPVSDERKMRVVTIALTVVSRGLPTVTAITMGKENLMRKRFVLLAALAAAVALAAAAFAFGGSSGLIFDDGHYVKPGSLDDGKQYLPRTTISLGQAITAARRAAGGKLGQVDLESRGGRVLYVVDVGGNEVDVDSADGSIAGIEPQS